jgi:hypothetical protein
MRTKRNHFPCLESPTRCTISSILSKRFISSDERNNLCMVEKMDDWYEWYLVPIANLDAFYIRNIRSKCFLSISKDYNQIISSEDKRDTWILENCLTSSVQEWHQYRIVHEESGKCVGEDLDTASGTSSLCLCQQNDDEKSNVKLKNIWSFEVHTGELCFISTPGPEVLSIRCNVFGEISPTKNKKGWEVWRFVETGGGFVKITSWVHDEKTLYSDQEGLVQTVEKREKTANIEDKWKVQKASYGLHGVIIQAVSSDRYLRLKNGTIDTTDVFEETSCVWHLTSANQNQYYLYSQFLNKRLSTNKSDPIVHKPSSSDTPWTVKYVSENESYELYSETHQKYLGSESNGKISVSPNSQDYEKWYVEESDDGSFNIVSMKHSRFLAFSKDGTVCTVTKIEESEKLSCKWYLDTAMPSALTGDQLLKKQLFGVAAIGMIVAAPFAVMGVIGSIGFTSGGVAAGSYAAGMMSAEAIAAGGGVMAGGTVATLQSIGAAGLGFAGTSAAMGTGAAVGGAVYHVAGRNLQKRKDSPGQMALVDGSFVDKKINNRPFCAWETW